MVRKTEQVGCKPLFESLDISYDGWDFIPSPGGSVAEACLPKSVVTVGSYSSCRLDEQASSYEPVTRILIRYRYTDNARTK